MKRLAFVLVLVAAIVGLVFGGLSVASAGFFDPTPHPTCTPKPSPTPAPTPCCDAMLQKIDALSLQVANLQNDLANVPIMETVSGGYQVPFGGSAYPIEGSYSEIRHVSLTIFVAGMLDPSDWVSIRAYKGGSGGNEVFSKIWLGAYQYIEEVNVQFDADYWHIYMADDPINGIVPTINFAVTMTYKPLP